MAVFLSACDQGPQGPSEVRGLRVEGPTAVGVGEVAEFRVVFQTAKETRDVSDVATWRVSQPFLTITRGKASGLGAGSVSVWADFDGLTSPPVQVQVESRIAGDYTLTIGGGICRWRPLPRDLTLRTYRASLSQHGRGLSLSLTGATFKGHPSGTSPALIGHFDASTDVATFDLPKPQLGWWNEGEDVSALLTEVLPDGSRIEIDGTVLATSGPSGLSGTFNGTFSYWPSSPLGGLGGDCESDRHQFTLAR